jgi:autotransporter-associated beta strand protein
VDNGALVFERSDVVTFPGVISGTGSVTQAGIGTAILTGNNTYSGGTTITAGTLQLGNGGATGSIIGNVADNGTLAFDRSDIVTLRYESAAANKGDGKRKHQRLRIQHLF